MQLSLPLPHILNLHSPLVLNRYVYKTLLVEHVELNCDQTLTVDVLTVKLGCSGLLVLLSTSHLDASNKEVKILAKSGVVCFHVNDV
jgi:hypothetical protein